LEQHCIDRYLRRYWVQQPDLFAAAGVAAAICSPHSCCWCGCLCSEGSSSHAINSSSSGGRRYSSTTAAASAPVHQHFFLPLRLLRPAPIAHPSFESGLGLGTSLACVKRPVGNRTSRPAALYSRRSPQTPAHVRSAPLRRASSISGCGKGSATIDSGGRGSCTALSAPGCSMS